MAITPCFHVHPKISIIMATYNRANVLPRAITSVLRQTYPLWELIIVDDGSIDDTISCLSQYPDSRIIKVILEENRGVNAARNAGLDRMSGTWFTFLDSDDEIKNNALERLVIFINQHPNADAITCNCIDTSIGAFSGEGIEETRPLGFEEMVRQCRGEHWGITSVNLLRGKRFDERLPGLESTMWYPISVNARRYYLHEGLRIYHTEDADRISTGSGGGSLDDQYRPFLAVFYDHAEYLSILREYAPDRYGSQVFCIAISAILKQDETVLDEIRSEVQQFLPLSRRLLIASGLAFGPRLLRPLLRFAKYIRGKASILTKRLYSSGRNR